MIAAETVREACHLGQVLFIPASDPPHKRYPEMAPAKDRVEMVLLAILNHTQFELSSHELRRDGPSYTVDTLRELRREMGEDVELFLIIGADNALEIPTWHCPDVVLELAKVLVVRRPGADLSGVDGAVATHLQMVESSEIEISSTDIRARIREGRSIRYQVPFEVEKYINDQGLYR